MKTLFAAFTLALVLVGGTAAPASAAPVSLDVSYTYDAAASTFTLYVTGEGPVQLSVPTLSVDRQAAVSTGCNLRTWY